MVHGKHIISKAKGEIVIYGLSIIIPFLNEESGIVNCLNELESYRKNANIPIEVVLVDDGSTDNTLEIIKDYEFKNIERVKIVSFSKNFGSHAAIRAGLKNSTYDISTWIGADLQEPLEFIKLGIEKISNGYDMVCIEKKSIQTTFFSRFFSKVYSYMMRKYAISNYSSGGISTIIFNKKVRDTINDNVENNSSIMLQLLNSGYKQFILPMTFSERVSGKSKWTLKKKMKLFIDSFVAFSFMPIRLVSTIGILMFLAGLIFGIMIIVNRLFNEAAQSDGYATLACLISIGFGVTNISLGIIAEYLWRTYDASMRRPSYIISDIIRVKEID